MRLRHAFATMAGATLLLGASASAAVAQDYPGGTTPPGEVLSETDDRPDEVLGTTTARPEAAAAQTLPVTGGDLAGLAVVGVSLVGLGTVVVRRSRRTAPVAA